MWPIMELFIQVNGLKTKDVDLEDKSGLTVQYFKEHITTIKRMESESSNGLMATTTLGNLKTIKKMDKVHSNIMIIENILEIG